VVAGKRRLLAHANLNVRFDVQIAESDTERERPDSILEVRIQSLWSVLEAAVDRRIRMNLTHTSMIALPCEIHVNGVPVDSSRPLHTLDRMKIAAALEPQVMTSR